MFTRTIVAAAASACLVGAQSSDSEHTHAAFAFVRTGERTPILRNDTQVLTTVGATQMHALGQRLRTKYVTGTESIAGLSKNILDNDQVWVQTLDTPYLVSSAQAFMQGLYPPQETGNTTEVLADGTSVDYPLNGYQYASIHAANPYDPYSRLVSGTLSCPQGQADGLRYFTTPEFKAAKGANEDLYKKLDLDWFEGFAEQDELSYTFALELADYLSYQYAHNSSIHTTLTNDSDYTGVYDKLRHDADEVAWYLYGNTSASTTDSDKRAIGGKTLAGSILHSFNQFLPDTTDSENLIDNVGQINKPSPLTFFFGEQDAMVSLMSLMMLDSQSHDFKSIPPYGSAMIFELFSTGDSAEMPSDPNDLWVRFYFHNGTDSDNEPLQSYSIFNSGRSMTDMPYGEFYTILSSIGMQGLSDWCKSCSSPSLFCLGADGSGVTLVVPAPLERQEKPAVSPVVGGVIGAVISLVIAGLLFALVMLLAGIRFHRVEQRLGHNPKSELGGFKGSAKLASDPDVSLSRNGVPPAFVTAGTVGFGGDYKKGHERVGSWELRQKEFGKDIGEASPRSSFEAIDAVAARGVEPHDRV
ncbi:hypothetical protein ACET3X_009778 [Alternaria dauci]|uniref:Histidine acid phosphatase n=1 Tax=Alternaria dauci TaxID=48095 RepID=A0ABR3U789_9PLEO